MTAVLLRDPVTGQPLPAEYEHDWRTGQTTYRTRHGAFVLSIPFENDPGTADPSAVYVQYGTGDQWGYSYEIRPEAPVFFGIALLGAAVIRPDDMIGARGRYWISARRLTGRFTSESVPDGTRDRAGRVVHALACHWRELPEHPRLIHAYEVWKAPGRLGELQHRINIRREQIAKDQAELTEWLRLADVQAALAAEAEETV